MIAPARARPALGVSQIRSGMCQIRSGHCEHQKHIYSCSSLVNDPAPGEREQRSYASSRILKLVQVQVRVCRQKRGTRSRGPGSAAGMASPGSLPEVPDRPPGMRAPGRSRGHHSAWPKRGKEEKKLSFSSEILAISFFSVP